MRLGDLDALKKALEVTQYNDIDDLARTERLIDNAPTIAVDEEIERQREKIERQREEMYQSSKKLYETARMLGVERPRGEWIKNEGRDLRDCFYTCSKCGRNINVICGETLADYPFCHCGADMRGDEK